jgi:hypothetical protein
MLSFQLRLFLPSYFFPSVFLAMFWMHSLNVTYVIKTFLVMVFRFYIDLYLQVILVVMNCRNLPQIHWFVQITVLFNYSGRISYNEVIYYIYRSFNKQVLAETKCVLLLGCVWKLEGKKPFYKPGNRREEEIQNMAYSSDLAPSNFSLLLRMISQLGGGVGVVSSTYQKFRKNRWPFCTIPKSQYQRCFR